MRPFSYERPARLEDAIALLASTDGDGDGDSDRAVARPLAGGTDLIIRLRDGSVRPRVVIDVKRIAEFDGRIDDLDGGGLRFGALTTMTDIAGDPRVRRDFAALAEAAAVVGSVQIRNRATLVGNLCNASPAADTAPALLVDGARVIAVGPGGRRTIALDGFFVRSGVTTLAPGELVEAIEVPAPPGKRGFVHVRRTRRRGHDLASVTLACSVGSDGVTRLAYGSLGPRPLLVVDETGLLADPDAAHDAKAARLTELFVGAAPSARSLRASPDYRLAMLHVLGRRAVARAIERRRAA
jgi:carbon-monoxide dehydrogenase medium subunit